AGKGEGARVIEMPLPGAFYLLGLMHGHWEIREGDFNEIEMPSAAEDEEPVNLGIAIVVPAKKILDILYRRELVEQRRQRDQERQEREGWTTPDAEKPK